MMRALLLDRPGPPSSLRVGVAARPVPARRLNLQAVHNVKNCNAGVHTTGALGRSLRPAHAEPDHLPGTGEPARYRLHAECTGVSGGGTSATGAGGGGATVRFSPTPAAKIVPSFATAIEVISFLVAL